MTDTPWAVAQKRREWYEARKVRLIADPTIAPHGEASTYSNYGCRCEDCSRANSIRSRDYKRKLRSV